MASLLDLILAKVRGGPLDYLPAEPEPRTTADGGLDLRALLTGAQVQPEAKSQYEPTLAAGEQRSVPELQDMLWNVVNSAGMESIPGVGPHKLEQRAPGRVRAGSEKPFAEWFGKSKVVDEDGTPLTVYHGTSGELEKGQFDNARLGKTTGNVTTPWGHFFTPHTGEAAHYTETFHKKNGAVVPVHLRVEDPYVMSSGEYDRHAMSVFRGEKTEPEAMQAAREFRDSLIREGYDGIFIRRGGRLAEVVAFNPEQIKSATGNRGTYSRQSADIRE